MSCAEVAKKNRILFGSGEAAGKKKTVSKIFLVEQEKKKDAVALVIYRIA
jgi:hypothetical protein